MRAVVGLLAVVAAHLTACVSVNQRVVLADDVVARTEAVGEEVDVTWTGSVAPGEHAFEIHVAGERQCRRLSEQQVVRRTTLVRSPDRMMLGTSIVAGLVLAVVGGVFLYDHRDGQGTEEPLLYRGDANVGRGTGIALLATGALSLSSAAIAGLRARDEVRVDAKPSVRRVPVEGTSACGAARASGIQITLGRGDLTVPGGTTDDDGKLAIPYTMLPAPLVAAAGSTALRVSASDGKRTFVVGDVSVMQPHKMHLAAAWRDAETGGDPARLERYAQLDPERATAALARARALRMERVTAKLAARDATAAGSEIEVLQQRHAHGPEVDALARQLEALRTELQTEERAQRRESVMRALAAAVATVQGEGASPEAFEVAHTQLEEARRTYADEPKMGELAAAFETARAARVKALLADSQRRLRVSAFDLARRAARDAERVAPDDPRVARAVKAVDDRELVAIEREARKALAAGRMDDAVRAIDRGAAIRPDDPGLARLIAEVRASSRRERDRAQAATLRARDAVIRAELAVIHKATRAGNFEAARRALAEGRRNHGEEPRWTTALTRVDKAELDAELRRAEKALAGRRIEEAKAHVDRAFVLGPEDPRLVRLVAKIRTLSRARATTSTKEGRP